MHPCKNIGCDSTTSADQDYCTQCLEEAVSTSNQETESLSSKYPQYYKPVGNLTELDVYAVHHLFALNDPSGCLHHASKKLLLSGVRTGGKSTYKDIKEAKDTLIRWLELNQP